MDGQKNVIKDRILLSPHDGKWSPLDLAGSSIILQFKKEVKARLEENGGKDFVWLRNVLTGEQLTATEGLDMAVRYACVLHDAGIGSGDVIHCIVGNENHLYPLAFGAWIIGAAVSTGDINLEAKLVATQLQLTKVIKLIRVTSAKNFSSVF